MYFDTHAHYDDARFDGDRAEVLSGLKARGVDLVVNVGCDLPSSLKSVELAGQYDFVYAAVGTHPHDAAALSDGDLALYRSLYENNPKVKAIGEIGLDYHYDLSPRAAQREAFDRQMQLARDLDAPVIIHSREACEDTMDAVRRYPGVRGVFHCYAYSVETARELIKRGWSLSFTGACTFKNARKAIEVLNWTPLSRLMIETDAPYLTPEPFRGRRNDSGYVGRVAETIAAVKGIPVEDAAWITRENGMKFFGIEGCD